MQCTNPMFLKSQGFWVPCGRCLGCKIAHSREWTIRLLHELSTSDTGCFLTLTYDEEHCPISLRKKDLQKFWKRIRKQLKKQNRNIKYFACGEYGDQYGRPHYHAIVFGLDWNDEDLVTEEWPFGFHKFGSVTVHSCGYVTEYCLKKFGRKKDDELYTKLGLEPPFQLCSQGLGLNFALRNSQQLHDNLGITLNGQPVGLPRYYVKKLDIDVDIMREFGNNSRAEKVSKICRRMFNGNKVYISNWDSYLRVNFNNPVKAYVEAAYKQSEETYKARKRNKKGVF